MHPFSINIKSAIITQIYAGAFPVQWRTVQRRENDTTATAAAYAPVVSGDAGARSRFSLPGRTQASPRRVGRSDYRNSAKPTDNTLSLNPPCTAGTIAIHDSDNEIPVSSDDEDACTPGGTSSKSSRNGQAHAAQVDALDPTSNLIRQALGTSAVGPIVSVSPVIAKVAPASTAPVVAPQTSVPTAAATSVLTAPSSNSTATRLEKPRSTTRPGDCNPGLISPFPINAPITDLPALHSKVPVAFVSVSAAPVGPNRLSPIHVPLTRKAHETIGMSAVSQVYAPPTPSSAVTSSSASRLVVSHLSDREYRSLIFEARYSQLPELSATTDSCESTLFSCRGTPPISPEQSSPASARATNPSVYSRSPVPSVSVSQALEFGAIVSGTPGQHAARYRALASSVPAAANGSNGISGAISRPITKFPGDPAASVAISSPSLSDRAVASRYQAGSHSVSQRTVATPSHLQEATSFVAEGSGLSLAPAIATATAPAPTLAPGSILDQDPGIAHAAWAADLPPCKWCNSVTESKAYEDMLETDIMLHMKKRVRRYKKLMDFLAKSRGILRKSERNVFMHRIRVQEWKAFWKDYLAPHHGTHGLHTQHTLWSIKFFSQLCRQYLGNDCAFKDCLDLMDAVLLERNTVLSNAGEMSETEFKNGQFVQAIEMYCQWKEGLEVSGRDGLMNFGSALN
ncbi:hypothetical protein EDD21DRAFT_412273 [Dissophora ornata]|nr:hypothetical protein BGZ58_005910 [Dissophora ornata]KAI8604220.1 hypothetical protein EDD21DRAFT_412273 [Dissophora ornata]